MAMLAGQGPRMDGERQTHSALSWGFWPKPRGASAKPDNRSASLMRALLLLLAAAYPMEIGVAAYLTPAMDKQ